MVLRDIKNALVPKNILQLKSFHGLINYYGTFLDSLSHVLAPLYRLLQNTEPWSWESPQQKCFDQATYLLTSGSVHFDPEKELVLACDASMPLHMASELFYLIMCQMGRTSQLHSSPTPYHLQNVNTLTN